MPRGIPKPPNACQITGCYEIAAASVKIWHDGVGGYRTARAECCLNHAAGFERGINTARNGAYVTWYQPTEGTE